MFVARTAVLKRFYVTVPLAHKRGHLKSAIVTSALTKMKILPVQQNEGLILQSFGGAI